MEVNLKKDRNSRRKPIDISTMIYGKVPPQSKELEEAVLGAIMLEKNAFDTAIEILKPECFYSEAHQRIFAAMRRLADKSSPVDILTVVEELKTQDELDMVGGPFYVTKLTNSVVSAANIEAHARIILQKFIQRELIRISGEIISDAYEDTTDIFDLLDSAESKLFEITDNHLRQNFEGVDSLIVKTIKRIEELRNKSDEMTGVPSGYKSLDAITYGWQPSDLIILAARPSVGKTAFALNLARNAALHPTKPVPVAIFSLEMSSEQIVQRILSAETDIHLEKISRGRLENYEFHQLNSSVAKLAKAPIFIDDTPALNIFELRAKCRRLKGRHDVGLIIVDYLQLMSSSNDNRNGNREQEISKISRDLKALAKELHVPVIALSQLSREVEKRKDSNKMPQLSDLRESGAIEQDADLVMFLYRPEYYEITANEMGESVLGETHVRIAKHRNGALDNIKLKMLHKVQKFIELTDSDTPGNFGANPFAGISPQYRDNDSARLFIQKGSKMNDMDFNDENDPAPF
jgi:replicative DNA helicase